MSEGRSATPGAGSDALDFFVSRTASDREWAQWIGWQLEQMADGSGHPLSVLLQDWDFVPGTNFMAMMEQGLRRCARLIPVISRRYLTDSAFGDLERHSFLRRDPRGLERRVIPVRVEDVAMPESLLDATVPIDLFDLDEDEARRRLADGIASALRGRAKPTSPPLFPGSPASKEGERPPGSHPAFPGGARTRQVTSGPVGSDEPGSDTDWLTGVSNVVAWPHGIQPTPAFVGREKELADLDRWADDERIRLVGVTSLGGAGKTALIAQWLLTGVRRSEKPFAGVFGWSFYENPSSDEWVDTLVSWCRAAFGHQPSSELAGADQLALHCLSHCPPVLLVLDGLEVLQRAGDEHHGELRDDTLRRVLLGLCRIRRGHLTVLTSRFSFADLESFDGASARMIGVPGLSVDEGTELLAAAAGDWVEAETLRRLVRSVEGHALGTAVLASALEDRAPSFDTDALLRELARLSSLSARVDRILKYYARTFDERDRKLVAIVSLFQRPVRIPIVLAIGGTSERLGRPLAGCDEADIRLAVHRRLSGLLSITPDLGLAAHPVIRDHFRPEALSADSARIVSETTLADLPSGPVQTRQEAEQVVEVMELLLDAGEWAAADELYRGRVADGWLWLHLPAVRLGRRAATAFVGSLPHGTSERPSRRRSFYLNEAALLAARGGALDAIGLLREARDAYSDRRSAKARRVVTRSLIRHLLLSGQSTEALTEATSLSSSDAADPRDTVNSTVVLAQSNDLLGRTAEADAAFVEANEIHRRHHADEPGLYSANGLAWADFLQRTGRAELARPLLEGNVELCRGAGWTADAARCEVLHARHASALGRLAEARNRLRHAEIVFRGGGLLPDLATVLAELAAVARWEGDPARALEIATESTDLCEAAALVPGKVRALAERSRALTDLARAADARDAADQALRLATLLHLLPWSELVALEAGEYAADGDGGASTVRSSEGLRARLCPPSLRADPLSWSGARS